MLVYVSLLLWRKTGNELVIDCDWSRFQGNPPTSRKKNMCFGRQIFATGELFNYL